MIDYLIFHRLMSGEVAEWRCAGRSMEPVYFDGEPIFIFPFTKERPEPLIGDVVHFYSNGYFNRHQVADIFTDCDSTTWYRLVMGNGLHDEFVPRHHIVGYVIPKRMFELGTEPRFAYGKG